MLYKSTLLKRKSANSTFTANPSTMFIYYRHNHGLKEIHTGLDESLPVATKTDEPVYVPFYGFISAEEARVSPMAKPCKILQIEAFSEEGAFNRTYLGKGALIQGCIVKGGVYCVTENGKPKVIKGEVARTVTQVKESNVFSLSQSSNKTNKH